MTSIEVAAVVLVAAWLSVLTLLVLLLVRQLGLIGVRLAAQGTAPDQSLPIGTPLPAAVTGVLPELADELAYLVFLSSTCSSCTDFARDLDMLDSDAPVRVFVAGVGEATDDLAALVPDQFPTIREPIASTVAEALQIRGTPIALQVERGILTGRAIGTRVEEIRRLLDAYTRSDSQQLATSLREVIDSART
jgi:hypothetical protein